MSLPSMPETAAGRAGLAAILADPARAVLALDFDGTLAPIVTDPQDARARPEAVHALARLAPRLAGVAVITGRPAADAVRFGGFESVAGLEGLTVLGAYGAERWDAADPVVRAPEPPAGVADVRAELPAVLAASAAPQGTWTEDKGRALAVHTRRAATPDEALDRLRAPLYALAERHGLVVEPGRMVLELRPPGADKGAALTGYVHERAATAVAYAGDDLGDVPAYDAVEALRREGVPGLLIYSAPETATESVEELRTGADLRVTGPAGLAAWLEALADEL
ncbi:MULTISPECIES: trehalose-phosphatase [Streptomyces]|uniref:Trehalose 6-phosphate phosphatase n=1 Tax=Streptomyces spirodelae TaxID=2812904 RepID=A0ABS3WXN1_9ACTN|nr:MULTISPECIES: trehalose-phosphatase [Streptomyces]MBO8187877.1 trehalose-phosphatase [Streptomyces spirodelae]UNZ18665.1 trehalose-phosphatase [Streptomyces sp. 891-h]